MVYVVYTSNDHYHILLFAYKLNDPYQTKFEREREDERKPSVDSGGYFILPLKCNVFRTTCIIQTVYMYMFFSHACTSVDSGGYFILPLQCNVFRTTCIIQTVYMYMFFLHACTSDTHVYTFTIKCWFYLSGHS